MSITSLTNEALVQLFPNQLVIVETETRSTTKVDPAKQGVIVPVIEPPKPVQPEQAKPLTLPSYLGGFQKKILILHQQNNTKHISDEALQLLTGILNACKLNLQDVGIMNLDNPQLHYQEIMEALHPTHLFSFGLAPAVLQLPFQIPNYQAQSYNNAIFLFAASFDDMLPQSPISKEEKTKLWNSLKKIFQL
jgi:hypothetical protein